MRCVPFNGRRNVETHIGMPSWTQRQLPRLPNKVPAWRKPETHQGSHALCGSQDDIQAPVDDHRVYEKAHETLIARKALLTRSANATFTQVSNIISETHGAVIAIFCEFFDLQNIAKYYYRNILRIAS